MAAGPDSVAWNTGCANGDQDLAVTGYTRAAESDTSKGSDPWALDGDWAALGAVQKAEVAAPFADEHWTGRADTTGLITTSFNSDPATLVGGTQQGIDPSYQFYGTRRWTLYSFGRQKAFNYPFCTSDPIYATYVAMQVVRPPVLETSVRKLSFARILKQGSGLHRVEASVTYPDGREGVPTLSPDTPVQIQLYGGAKELGHLQWENGSPAPNVVPFSAVNGSDSEIYYKTQESKDHEVAVSPVQAQIEIEPVPDSIKVQQEPERFHIGGYNYAVTLGTDTLEIGEETTVDVDPVYPDGDTVQVDDDVLVHEMSVYGYTNTQAQMAKQHEHGKRRNPETGRSKSRAKADPMSLSQSWRTVPVDLSLVPRSNCVDPGSNPAFVGRPARWIVPDSLNGYPLKHVDVGCKNGIHFTTNLPQNLASRNRIRLVSDSTTYQPKAGEQVDVLVEVLMAHEKYGLSYGVDQFLLVPARPDTVLLGETRYYQAVEKNGSLELEAVPTDGCEAPSLDGGKANATFTVEPETGDSLGVYYDTERWGCVNEDGTVQTGELPDGLIRITGRYWQPDTRYAVTLEVAAGGKTGTETIHVGKPTALNDPSADESFDTYTDATGRELDVDSLLTRFAGRYGVPPHYLKGLIEQETCGDRASYRYEPGKDLRYRMDDSGSRPIARWRMENNPYWIEGPNDEGTPPIPTDHDVCTTQRWDDYPGYLKEEGTLYDPFQNLSRAERLNDYSYDRYVSRFGEEFEVTLRRENSQAEARNLAHRRTAAWVADSIDGEGLKNISKQTRQMASYGPMQLMYIDAIHEGDYYPEDKNHRPERLNTEVDSSIQSSLKFYVQEKFKDVGRFWKRKNWAEGWSETLLEAANRYNGQPANYRGADDSEAYGIHVWRRAENYDPQR